MGYLLLANCKCGYKSKTLQQGVGFNYSEDGSYYEVAYCDGCKRVQDADSSQVGASCKRCKAPLRFYKEDIEMTETSTNDFGFPNTDYLEQKEYWHCPKCKQETLTFSSAGLWD